MGVRSVPRRKYCRRSRLVFSFVPRCQGLLQVSVEFFCLSITVIQFLFTALTGLFHKKCNRLKARVVIYSYNHHVRLLSPGPMVVKQPQFTRVEEPTLLCNQWHEMAKTTKAAQGTAETTDRSLKISQRAWLVPAAVDM